MSSIIFVNAVVYVLMMTSTVAYASLEDSTDHKPWGWEELYIQNQKDRDKDWDNYTNCDPQEVEFNVFNYGPNKSPYLCTKEESLEIADNHVNNLLYILNNSRATFLKSVEKNLANSGMTKDHPNYTEALELPRVKEQIDSNEATYNKYVEGTKKYGEEVRENIKNGTPFSCEANKKFWEDYLRDLDESEKIWNDYLSVYSDSDSQAPSCVSLNGCEEEQEEKIAESQTENSYSYCNIC